MNEMNEQEKKTFKFLKDVYNLNFESCTIENCDIKNIVNIIEKLQKEIEDLKTLTREYEAYELGEGNKIIIASKEWFADGYFKNFLSDYISKDKIKEEIENLKQYKEEIKEEKDTEYYTTLRIIKALRKLLVSGQESDQEGGQENE